ncbi:hypothetical protein ACFWQG_13175 [Rhodococcus sp. NPDC058532]|uniref:hypothetical protein n=1 Tax=Rhodococcus sp. NPDC058532 TaxID=3346540 RepID=UPI003668DA8E
MTSNEIDTYTQPAQLILADVDPSDLALERIEKQARAMSAAHQLGTALAGTDMVPADYKGKPDNATAAILFGAELGLTAIQSLQNIFVVRGKPAMYGRTMAALVVARGHHLAEVETSPESVTWAGRRADNGQEFSATWTMDRAKQAGFLSNEKYAKQPTEMLRAKAQTEVCRTLFADVLLGMSHSVEDLDLEQPPIQATAERVRSKAKGVAGVSAALGITAAPEPETAPEPKGATTADIKKLDAALTAAGITDQDERRTFLSARVGRDLAAAKDLTRDEIAAVVAFVQTGEEKA